MYLVTVEYWLQLRTWHCYRGYRITIFVQNNNKKTLTNCSCFVPCANEICEKIDAWCWLWSPESPSSSLLAACTKGSSVWVPTDNKWPWKSDSIVLSMINFAIHLHMYVWIINQQLTWPSLRRDGTCVCFLSSSLPVVCAVCYICMLGSAVPWCGRCTLEIWLCGRHVATNRVRSGELGVLGECRCHSVLFVSVCDLHLASEQLHSVHLLAYGFMNLE